MIQVFFYSKRRSLNSGIDFLAFIQYHTENGPDLAIPNRDKETVVTVMGSIVFSGITCISKGFQDMTCCPISSKTKHTRLSVPLSSEGCSLPSWWMHPMVLFLCIKTTYFLFSGQQSLIIMWRVPVLLPAEYFSYCIFKCHSKLRADACSHSSFFLWFCFLWRKKLLWARNYLSLYFLIN